MWIGVSGSLNLNAANNNKNYYLEQVVCLMNFNHIYLLYIKTNLNRKKYFIKYLNDKIISGYILF